jgi:integrase
MGPIKWPDISRTEGFPGMANRKPTEKLLAKLPRKEAERASHPDRGPGGVKGGYIRVPPIGSTEPATYYAVARVPGARNPKWHPVGKLDVLTIEEARDRARPIIDRIRQGLSPTPEAALTFEALALKRQKLHVERLGLRSAKDIEWRMKKYIIPRLGHLPVDAIRKSVLSDWADEIVEASGPRMADICMADVIATLNWHSQRSDDFVAPARLPHRVEHGARERVLNETEIRVVWQASEDGGPMNGITRTALLTLQRLQKVMTMRWDDINTETGLWTIRTEAGEKNNAGTLRLPPLALDVIGSQPKVEGNPYVFNSGARSGYFTGVSYGKLQFDQKCTEINGGALPRWTLHDLRRTSRTVLAELGVSPDVGEAVIGHGKAGVRGIYDRALHHAPKADALRMLAAYIQDLVDPDRGKVIPFARTAG